MSKEELKITVDVSRCGGDKKKEANLFSQVTGGMFNDCKNRHISQENGKITATGIDPKKFRR